ncbi:thiol:disulfide interchange protein DsbA/DsbL [Thermomonas sp. HDW16]|uniref:thiol:disulfide interchange protein DsbA/DsbL n=1 Tax=Thermomonas sp. HDW16 TaxID=2714945 RepID=UPI00140B7946|nr:thiol:disulfide interchange protein DsbA/DsbL [Thermomonas sp. HDW16]QIL19679.1 thiol:disulfide interchange protein DsbA/DsbL [Thermomonas sp. HDW16]
MRAILLSLSLLVAAAFAPAHAQQTAPLPGLTEGVEYKLIEGGKPYRGAPGKIEVAEVFGYWCPHCAHFAPMLEKWKATMPANAQLVLVPAMFDPNDAFARLFFIAEGANAVGATHDRVFRAIHETGELPRNATIPQLTAFYTRLPGVNAKAFATAQKDEATLQAKAANAREFQMRSNIPGTPSLVIAGKYLVLGNSYEGLLANASRILKAIGPVPKKPAPKPAKPTATKPRT